MAPALRRYVVTRQVEVPPALSRLGVVQALEQQPEGHAGRPGQVAELGARTAAQLPAGQGSPKASFRLESCRRDVDAQLVDQAASPTGPGARSRPLALAAVVDHAERKPPWGTQAQPTAGWRGQRPQAQRLLCPPFNVVHMDIEVAPGSLGPGALYPHEGIAIGGRQGDEL